MNKPYLVFIDYFEIFKTKYWEFREKIFSKIYDELDKGIVSSNNNKNKGIIYEKNFNSNIYFSDIKNIICCKDEIHGIILKDKDNDFIICINILKKISINNKDNANEKIEEWVCSADYAIFLLYYVYKLTCVFPFFKDSSIDTIKENSKEESCYSNDSNNSNNLSEVSESLSTFENMEMFLMRNDLCKIDTEYNINTKKIFDNKFNKNSILEINEKYLKILFKEKYEFIKNYNFKINNSSFYDFFIKIFDIKKNIIHLFRNSNFFEFINIISTLDIYYKHSRNKYFFHLNMNIWNSINSKRKLKKYIAFSLVNCFKKEQFDNFNLFFSKIRVDICSIKDLLIIIFDELEKLNKIIIIVIEDFDFINFNLFIKGYEKYKNLKFLFIFDISKDKNNHILENYINNINNDMFCYRFLNLNDEFYEQNDKIWLNFPYTKNNYESLLNKNLQSFLEKELFINLFKIINYRSFCLNDKNNFDNNFLINHLIYINLYCENKNNKFKISNIYFKDELIKKKYYSIYNKKLLEFLNQDDNIINNVLQKEDGIIFEKGIIYQIMMNKMNIDFDIFGIDNLYCFDKNKNYFNLKKLKDKNIFFKQASSKGEKYDCGFLIQQEENIYIKLYQITKNKYQTELNKLERNILNLDVEYMSNQLEKIGFKKIKKISFGIISNFNLYSKYLDNDKNSSFLQLRNFCKIQKYEFLLFDFKKLNFYIEENVNQMFCVNNNNKNNNNIINFIENNEMLYLFNDFYKFDFLDFPLITKNLTKRSTKHLDIKNELTNLIFGYEKNNDKNNLIILGNFINNMNDEIKSEIIQNYSKNNIGVLSYGITNKNEQYLSLSYKNDIINYEKSLNIIEINNNNKFSEKINDKKIKKINVIVFEVDCDEKFLGKKTKAKNEIANLFNFFYKKNKKYEHYY